MYKFISVVIPVYNEEKYIVDCIESLLKQTYPKEYMEIIFVDGNSKDKTALIIKEYSEKHPYIKLLSNPERIVPISMNLGIGKSKGEYIIRLDAHAKYACDYIEKCVYYLDNTDADNVGGVAVTKANGFIGTAISKMLSTKFGVGGSDFRTGEGNKYVDTVPFGAFRREVFEKVGLFNPKLLRSEDNDMNSRIRESGGKIWLSEDIRFEYFCRDTIKGILKMALQNGNALFRTLKENPKAMSVRHFIPFLFTISLIIMPILSFVMPYLGYLFALELLLYFLLDLYFSFSDRDYKYGFVTIWLYPLFHIVYGLGSLAGLVGITFY